MKEKFDFKKIGKTTPYKVPDNFFTKMQNQVLQRLEHPHKKPFIHRIWPYSISAAAILLIFFSIYNLRKENTSAEEQIKITAETQWIENLSDEELEQMVTIAKFDLFIQ